MKDANNEVDSTIALKLTPIALNNGMNDLMDRDRKLSTPRYELDDLAKWMKRLSRSIHVTEKIIAMNIERAEEALERATDYSRKSLNQSDFTLFLSYKKSFLEIAMNLQSEFSVASDRNLHEMHMQYEMLLEEMKKTDKRRSLQKDTN